MSLAVRAAEELRRIIYELIIASGLSNEAIAERMGYKSRVIVSVMRNHKPGEPLYPKSALFAFLHAVGVSHAEDVRYVSQIYDYAAGRETSEHEIVQRPVRRNWQQEDGPDTSALTLSTAQHRIIATMLHCS